MSLDAAQRQIVALDGVHALVLAGPGCGKTHLLSQRIIAAHSLRGVSFDDMVCLTFTNRASREMSQRIHSELGYRPEGLYVGNIHRFCIRFLFDNRLIESDSTIIDEEDQDLWLSEALRLRTAGERKQITDLATLLFQQEHNFAPSVRRRLAFAPSAAQINAANTYIEYKRRNHLLDFDDALLFTYDALNSREQSSLLHASYRWIQVDEVQDLTPMQLAIVDMITSPDRPTAVFFGDEQQAIFEFIGAGGPALDRLKSRCRGNIYRLSHNYRAPGYLVDLCNAFAVENLGNARNELPDAATIVPPPLDNTHLQILSASTYDHNLAIAARIRYWRELAPDENVAVLVRVNADAEALSATLFGQGIDHTLIARKDLFKKVDYKTIYSHLAVVRNPTSMHEWTRILYQTRCVRTMAEARNLIYNMSHTAMTPVDLFSADGLTTVERIVDMYNYADVVVFDTETTGLDVFDDDIVQISAVKYSHGQLVDDGGFNVYLASSRRVPETLAGGAPNPLVDILRRTRRIAPADALRAFAEYTSGAVLCAHNAEFDITMLRNSWQRNVQDEFPDQFAFDPIDTLLAAKLLLPIAGRYTLADLITRLEIDGVNSHNAADDVAATAKLFERLAAMGAEMLPAQQAMLDSNLVKSVTEHLRKSYLPLYFHSLRLRNCLDLSAANTLAGEMDYAYHWLAERRFIKDIPLWPAVVGFVSRAINDYADSRRFGDQLARHLHELRTFNEGDLLESGIIGNRVTVMTVHKAKGLEFDNVIVHDAGGRFWGDIDEAARVLYVAFSRARKRLAVFYTGQLHSTVVPLARFFARVSPEEVQASALIERLHSRRR